jgi:hypothetical protein
LRQTAAVFLGDYTRQMRKLSLLLFFSILFFICSAQTEVSPKSYRANRILVAPRIDGDITDDAWKSLTVATNYTMSDPTEGNQPTYNTEVKIAYDNTAIYIAAKMFDPHSDSIFRELGNRDEGGSLRADNVRIGFDTYNTQQDAYIFNVTASGVQSEEKFSDPTYDAVWQSAVSVNPDGWSAEIKIPFSAIRFPTLPTQTWGLQLTRYVARTREFDQWALTPKKESNSLRFWGKLEGLENIEAPLRLSLTPYISFIYDQSPVFDETGSAIHTESGKISYDKGTSFSGGADLKYGIDERFTLDMTLLPDFTQVQSDNKVKNLTAFETVYDENRSFFKEGTELFTKGNLFYSRRIGRTPSLYYSLPYNLNEGDVIVSNPDKARLLNATKFSGRTNKKLGIGIFNAVTGNTYATVRDSSGNEREILTEPLTNYNIFVLDQQLKNNADIYVINTNTMREGSADDANVSGTGFSFQDKKNKHEFSGRYSNSFRRTFILNDDGERLAQESSGNLYGLYINRISGEFQWNIFNEYADRNYNKNDLGQLFYYDFLTYGGNINYNKYNKFWKIFKESYNNIGFNYNTKPSDGKFISSEIWMNLFTVFTNYFGLGISGGKSLAEYRNEYEPRQEGRYFISPHYYWASLNMSTNYNKRAYVDFGGRTNSTPKLNNYAYGFYVMPTFRFNDRFSLKLSQFWDVYLNDVGYAANTGDIIFGSRDIKTITNTATLKYLFKNDMSLNVIARHYWSKGEYNKYYLLLDNGRLSDNTDYSALNNFNSNYFNIDVVYSWQFSPGSSFILTIKNALEHDEGGLETFQLPSDYMHNARSAFNYPRTTTVALKVLYYLDYNYLRKKGA